VEISEVKELKAKMERDIAGILEDFERKTGLQPGTVFRERLLIQRGNEFYYKVNIPVHF
jgi:hypothetical protein